MFALPPPTKKRKKANKKKKKKKKGRASATCDVGSGVSQVPSEAVTSTVTSTAITSDGAPGRKRRRGKSSISRGTVSQVVASFRKRHSNTPTRAVLPVLSTLLGGSSGSAPDSAAARRFSSLKQRLQQASAQAVMPKHGRMPAVAFVDLIEDPPLTNLEQLSRVVGVATLGVGSSVISRKRVGKLLGRLAALRAEERCTGVLVIAPHRAVRTFQALRKTFSQQEFFHILPSQEDQNPKPDLVWYCGGFKSSLYRCAQEATIERAIEDRKANRPFARVAKTWDRLEELVDDACGLEASNGVFTSRRANHLFSKSPSELRGGIQMDHEATYSVTDEVTADEITKIILSLEDVHSNTTIVDGTACIGGNLLSFARSFRGTVVGIEFDKGRCDMLRHNVGLYRGHGLLVSGNLDIRAGNFVRLLRSGLLTGLGACVVFLDPPFGGLNYKDAKSCELRLADLELAQVAALCLKSPACLYCVVKVPFNVSVVGLRQAESKGQLRILQRVSLSKRLKLLILGRRGS